MSAYGSLVRVLYRRTLDESWPPHGRHPRSLVGSRAPVGPRGLLVRSRNRGASPPSRPRGTISDMRTLSGVCGFLTSALLISACGGSSSSEAPAPAAQPSAAESSSPPPPTESQRTREMEEKAVEATRRLEEAQASGQDPAQAFEQFERDRAEVNRMAEGQPPAEEPPPPPE